MTLPVSVACRQVGQPARGSWIGGPYQSPCPRVQITPCRTQITSTRITARALKKEANEGSTAWNFVSKLADAFRGLMGGNSTALGETSTSQAPIQTSKQQQASSKAAKSAKAPHAPDENGSTAASRQQQGTPGLRTGGGTPAGAGGPTF
jgi:hypothetical protein